MRSIQILGLTCLAALSCTAAADDAAGPIPHTRTILLARAGLFDSVLQGIEYPAEDRLRYLDGSGCRETRGCSKASDPAADPPRPFRYVEALNIGTYGPMKLKFTGDRVKLRVSF
jgi:hypothetical protein